MVSGGRRGRNRLQRPSYNVSDDIERFGRVQHVARGTAMAQDPEARDLSTSILPYSSCATAGRGARLRRARRAIRLRSRAISCSATAADSGGTL